MEFLQKELRRRGYSTGSSYEHALILHRRHEARKSMPDGQRVRYEPIGGISRKELPIILKTSSDAREAADRVESRALGLEERAPTDASRSLIQQELRKTLDSLSAEDLEEMARKKKRRALSESGPKKKKKGSKKAESEAEKPEPDQQDPGEPEPAESDPIPKYDPTIVP